MRPEYRSQPQFTDFAWLLFPNPLRIWLKDELPTKLAAKTLRLVFLGIRKAQRYRYSLVYTVFICACPTDRRLT